MNLIAKLIIALLLGAAATALAILFTASKPVLLGITIITATVLTAFLGNLGQRRPAKSTAAAVQRKQPTKKAATGGSREEGEVKWFNGSKGFGFIVRPDGEEIFVHFRSIRGDGSTRRSLRDGQRVTYELGNSDKGPQAEDVEAL